MGTGNTRCSRRHLGIGLGLAAAALVGCDGDGNGPSLKGGTGDRSSAEPGRLTYRPTSEGTAAPGRQGEYPLQVGAGAAAFVLAPASDRPLRLVVLLHGAGGTPQRTLGLLRPYAERHHLLLVAPKSRDRTWDVISEGFGPDVRNIDELLQRLSQQYRVEGHTVAGFSDGASYALTLGISNGDVFDSVIAFSPGFEAAEASHGRPRFFVSHGVGDQVLPIDMCSRRLVPALQEVGYDVTYEEFDGGHQVPPSIREQALAWLGP